MSGTDPAATWPPPLEPRSSEDPPSRNLSSEDPPPEAPAPATPEVPWRRLDPRMLLVHPVVELVRFLPVLVGVFVLGRTGEPAWWQALSVAVPIVLGLLRYLTTRYRITGTQIELSRGLVSRNVLTARLDRVRAVEVTATLIHRVLGLAKVEIGTGSTTDEDSAFTLDGLPLREARTLRASLLHRTATEGPERVDGARGPAYDGVGGGLVGDEVLVRLDPTWVRYAPLTSSGNVIAAGLVAALGQFWDRLGPRLFAEGDVVGAVEATSVAVLLTLAVVAFLVLGAVLSLLGYLVTNWGFTLSRDADGRSFHVRRGLLTSTETSLERERVRGLEVSEPLGLRIAGAARLAAVVTGVSRKDAGSTQLVPPAPRGVVDATGAAVIGDAEPLRLPLLQHGPAARRRRWTRALAGAAVVPAALAVGCVTTALPWWSVAVGLLALPVGGALAADRYRRLGHALTAQHLVVRSGTLRGRRDVLQRTGIIGWTVQQTFFQRRAGLATLVATTAAGHQAYAAHDVPLGQAVALADAAVPGLLTPFLET